MYTPSPSSGTLTTGDTQSISYSTSCNFAFSIPVTITNSQSSATASPFQQLVNVSSSEYSSHAASNLQNVEFVYPNSTLIPSWLENYTLSYATWWLKLGSIPASSAITVYMGFASTSTNLFNGNTVGEAPTLSVQRYLPVTISNSQTIATVSPFDEELNVPSSVYSNYAASNLQNVEFYYPNGTIIPSWLENRTSSNAIWWLKLGSIPASSAITVYMGFASTSTNLFNTVNVGEAPQLSPSYAEYDDGFNVFNFYDDFAGTSLNTGKWTSSGTVSVDNGVTLGAGGVSGQINTISKSVVPSNMDLMGITYGTFDATTNSYSSMNYALNAPTASYITDLQGINSYYFAYYASSTNEYGNTIAYSGTQTGLYTFNASNDDKLTMDVVGHGVSSETYSAVSPYGNFTARTGIGPEIINYIAIASLPPNGVMPSASFGSVTTVSGTYGEYDNGANVFNYYFNGSSSSGWTTAGTAGQSSGAPSGSPFGTNALYADGASGDYMYTSLPSFSSTGNYIIQYYVNVGTLGDFFFTASSTGAGTMTRLDGRGGTDYVGLAKTASWTSWNGPSTSTTASENKWYLQSIVIAGAGTEVGDYLSTSLGNFGNLGSVVNTLATTYTDSGGTETYSQSGAYIGLVGDGGGGVSYWNGIIIRSYPPNGEMPAVSFGSGTAP